MLATTLLLIASIRNNLNEYINYSILMLWNILYQILHSRSICTNMQSSPKYIKLKKNHIAENCV